jgi:hypothetical protein
VIVKRFGIVALAAVVLGLGGEAAWGHSTTRVSVASGGGQANHDSAGAAIAAGGGRFVGFESLPPTWLPETRTVTTTSSCTIGLAARSTHPQQLVASRGKGQRAVDRWQARRDQRSLVRREGTRPAKVEI